MSLTVYQVKVNRFSEVLWLYFFFYNWKEGARSEGAWWGLLSPGEGFQSVAPMSPEEALEAPEV